MRIVDRPYCRPFRCAALPYVGQTHRTRWIDTGSELDREHVYLSEVAVQEAAKLIGWAPLAEVRARDEHIQRLNDRVQELEQELVETRKVVEAVDVLESADFTKRKKPGRPRKEEVVV